MGFRSEEGSRYVDVAGVMREGDRFLQVHAVTDPTKKVGAGCIIPEYCRAAQQAEHHACLASRPACLGNAKGEEQCPVISVLLCLAEFAPVHVQTLAGKTAPTRIGTAS